MKSLGQSTSAPVYVTKDAEILFNMEKSAMTSEWIFLNNLPENLRMKYNHQSSHDSLDIFLASRARVFQNSQLDVHEYLRREWTANRHSHEAIFENRPTLKFPTEREQLMIKTLYALLSSPIDQPKTCNDLLSKRIIITGNETH
jgi:hypothetical protein